ncbi:hypothetical protein BJ170DRAFT_331307 [Xylariales sp. AK1849]|nr:hypothetical protein BJ170DRAFT_331307 [Xylariales sp. AK1849]
MSLPTQIAETIQTAHIKRDPSPHHDLNPSTAASEKEPVRLEEEQQRQQHRAEGGEEAEEEEERDGIDLADEKYDGASDKDSEIPVSVLRPQRRRTSFPPMPDLRFEQSYLHSIRDAGSWGVVGWITVRDQIMMPFAQGILYNLAMCGWQHWNRNAQYSGGSVGARIRRWWYGVNNWVIPEKSKWKAA